MKGTLKALVAPARAIAFVLGVTIANLIALYIAAGVALHGDWDRVNGAIVRAYDEFFDE